MLKQVVACAVALAASASARALTITIQTADGQPAAFAQVQVVGRTGWSIADSNGTLTIEPDPKLPFQLLVTDSSGVLTQPLVIESLPATGALQVVLGGATQQEIDVLAAVPDAVLPPAAARVVIGRGDLDSRSPGQLTDVLQTIPGTGRLGDGVSAVPSIRGLARSRTLILLDGGRVSAERRAGPSASFLDPDTLAEIEVIRGPGSVAYGSESFGGVIRLHTSLPTPGDPSSLRYSASAGSNGDTRALNLEWTGSLAGAGLMLGANTRRSNPYESPFKEVFNSESKTRGGRAAYVRQVGRGSLSVLWRSDFGVDNGKPDANSLSSRTYYPQEDSHRLAVNYRLPGRGDWTRLSWSLNWNSYELITGRDRVASGSRGRRVDTGDVDAKDFGLRFDAERRLGSTTLVTGVDISGRYGLHATNRFLEYNATGGGVRSDVFELAVDEARRIDAAVFAQLGGAAGPFGWSAGARLDSVKSKNSGGFFGERSNSETVPSGFVSGAWHIVPKLDLTAQVSRGFREALLSDRYFRGISGRGFVVGNPDLDSESSVQYDVALRWYDKRWRSALYVFRYQIDDFIERFTNGNDFAFRNRDRATLNGVEFEVGASLPGNLDLTIGLSTLTGELDGDEFVTTTTPMADITPHTALVQVRQRLGERVSWMVRTASYRKDDRFGETERAIQGFTVVDASLAVHLSDAIEIQLLGRNLGDKAYYASPDDVADFAPGIGFELSLRGKF